MTDIMTHQFDELGGQHPGQKKQQTNCLMIAGPLVAAHNEQVNKRAVPSKRPLK